MLASRVPAVARDHEVGAEQQHEVRRREHRIRVADRVDEADPGAVRGRRHRARHRLGHERGASPLRRADTTRVRHRARARGGRALRSRPRRAPRGAARPAAEAVRPPDRHSRMSSAAMWAVAEWCCRSTRGCPATSPRSARAEPPPSARECEPPSTDRDVVCGQRARAGREQLLQPPVDARDRNRIVERDIDRARDDGRPRCRVEHADLLDANVERGLHGLTQERRATGREHARERGGADAGHFDAEQSGHEDEEATPATGPERSERDRLGLTLGVEPDDDLRPASEAERHRRRGQPARTSRPSRLSMIVFPANTPSAGMAPAIRTMARRSPRCARDGCAAGGWCDRTGAPPEHRRFGCRRLPFCRRRPRSALRRSVQVVARSGGCPASVSNRVAHARFRRER